MQNLAYSPKDVARGSGKRHKYFILCDMLEARLRFQMVPELPIGYQTMGLSEGRGTMSRKLATLCSIGLFAVATVVAHATPTLVGTVDTFTLTSGGTCCGTTGDFGTIKLTQTSSTLVTVVETLSS